jgi:ribosomal-protein-alanine acetyltransferase
MKKHLKAFLFRLLGKEPEAVVVSYATGDEAKIRAMVAEVRSIIPERRHLLVGIGSAPQIDGVETIVLRAGGVFALWSQLLSSLRRYRIGMAPVMFDKTHRYASLRLAAWLRTPLKILAYNTNLERHHLQLRSWLSSWLFWCGVPLDRIHLRPGWLRWTTNERTTVPDDAMTFAGHPPRRGYRRVGVLTPFLPYPLSHGGAVRLFHLLRELSLEYDVYLFAFRENERMEDLTPLLEFLTMIGVVSKPRYREPRWSSKLPPDVHEYESAPMRRLIEQTVQTEHISVMQVEYTQLARYHGAILVEHDVTFDLYQQLHDQDPSLSSWWNLYRWRRFEQEAVRHFRRVVTMSEKDAHLLDIRHATVIPNGVDLKRFRPSGEPHGERILFIGSFRHFPNVMAFQFLLREVWPKVKAAMPSATLTVVAGPDPEIYWKAATGESQMPSAEGIRLLPFVADVRPLYENANVVVVPTLVSAGTNVKVIEAMAMERAVLSTTSGCGGIPVRHGEHVWIADGAFDFASGLLQLLRDAGLRHWLARTARALVEQHFDWGKLGDMQRGVIRDAIPEQVVVRTGKLEDIDPVREIQSSGLPSSRWDPEHYMHHEFYVAAYDGRVAAFIVARNTAPDEREILNIAVRPEYRRLGLGERLLRHLIYQGKTGDVFLEVRESNHEARRLYERVGFVNCGRRPNYYDDPPETAVIMRIDTTMAAERTASGTEAAL